MARILVVDDEIDIRSFLVDELARLQHEVDGAANGIEALEKVKTWKPHLVLLDIRMPVMDGLTALKNLRGNHPEIAVIMMTADRNEDVAKDAVKAGAFDYVTKPVNLARLKMLVETKLIDVLGEVDTP